MSSAGSAGAAASGRRDVLAGRRGVAARWPCCTAIGAGPPCCRAPTPPARGGQATATAPCPPSPAAPLQPAGRRSPHAAVALPPDHRRRHHRHRARGLGARHRQQLGRPRPAHRTGQPPPRGRDVQARRGLDVLRQERDRVAAGHDLADQREARRVLGQGGPGQAGAGEQHPAGGRHLRGRDHHRRALGQPGVGERGRRPPSPGPARHRAPRARRARWSRGRRSGAPRPRSAGRARRAPPGAAGPRRGGRRPPTERPGRRGETLGSGTRPRYPAR